MASVFGNYAFAQYGSDPRSAPMVPMLPQPELLRAPEEQKAMPYFTENKLVIPRQASGVYLSAGPTSAAAPTGAAEISMKDRAALKKEVKDELKRENDVKTSALESRWFTLPTNTYGAAIWAILILEIDAISPLMLFRDSQSPFVPPNQQYVLHEGVSGVITNRWQWVKMRLVPFLSSLFFQLAIFGLSVLSMLLQFGFIYSLDQRIGATTFFDLEAAKWMCATNGWVQLISVGFFLAYMLGQVPQVLKNFLLIWTSRRETDEDRGEAGAKYLCIGKDFFDTLELPKSLQTPPKEKLEQEELDVKIKREQQRKIEMAKIANDIIKNAKSVPEKVKSLNLKEEKHYERVMPRTAVNHFLRQLFSTLFPLCELGLIVYLSYVGVKYIFWSGFTSLEQAAANLFPSFESGADREYPWMSNTAGVEEIIMATLALQFIMDIDEGLFAYVLPKSIQTSVESTRLTMFGWLPSKFKLSDYTNVGKHSLQADREAMDEEGEDESWDMLGWTKWKVLNEEKEFEEHRKRLQPLWEAFEDEKKADAADAAAAEAEVQDPYLRTLSTEQGPIEISSVDAEEFRKCLLRAKQGAIDMNASDAHAFMKGEADGYKDVYFDVLYDRAKSELYQTVDDPPGFAYEEISQPEESEWRFFAGSNLATEEAYSRWAVGAEDRPFSNDSAYDRMQAKLNGKVYRRLHAYSKQMEHDLSSLPKGSSEYLGRRAELNSAFADDMVREFNVQEVPMDEVFEAGPIRSMWVSLLPSATFIFTWIVLMVPIILVLLVRSRLGCLEFDGFGLDDVPGEGQDVPDDLSESAALLSPLIIVFVVVLVARSLTFFPGVRNASKAEEEKAQHDQANVAQEKMRKKRDKAAGKKPPASAPTLNPPAPALPRGTSNGPAPPAAAPVPGMMQSVAALPADPSSLMRMRM